MPLDPGMARGVHIEDVFVPIAEADLPPRRKLVSNEDQQTLSVPEAGKKYYGLSRNASYEAAKAGHIPAIRVGKLWRVPVRAMERIMDSVSLPSLPSKKSLSPPAKKKPRPKADRATKTSHQ